MNTTWLDWAIQNTPTKWWNDSAEPVELEFALARGATGVTTNPLLASAALARNRSLWGASIDEVLSRNLAPAAKAEALMRIAVMNTSEKLMREFESSRGDSGFVCAQVNPLHAGDRDCMYAMAKRLHQWAPNIAVKLPATAAGLDIVERCVGEGITVTATVSFTVPQAIAIAERHRAGARQAREKGIEPGKCFAVIMIGRLDDYLREVAHDNEASVSEPDIRQAGLAVTKRAYQIYREREYAAVLMVAALRGDYHLTEIVGADLVVSIHPSYQDLFISGNPAREKRIDRPIPTDVIERLKTMPEFIRSYEPDGMSPGEFVTFGATQRTLSQFCEQGWKPMESYR